MKTSRTLLVTLVLLPLLCASAQAPATMTVPGGELTLKQAIALALQRNPGVRSASAAQAAAAARLKEARSGYLPHVNYTESFQRGNNPVYVFGTLLTQHQFGPGNFAISSLNEPEPLNNFQSLLTVDQVLFDARRTSLNNTAARFGEQVAQEGVRLTNQDVIESVVQAYYGAVLAGESVRVAEEAVKSTQANLTRAENLRNTGMTTDADVLSLRVHLAAVREELIRARNSQEVAKAALNTVLAVPLETEYKLTSPLTEASLPPVGGANSPSSPAGQLTEYESAGVQSRPEARQALLASRIAGVQNRLARSAFIPEIGVHAALEADRGTFAARVGTNWLAAVSLRFNIFNGGADKARLEESAASLRKADADRERADSGIRLEVRRAYLDVRAAEQRIEVARATVAEAEESLRILQNRYENGLATVTDILRDETALMAARTRQLAAVYDQRLAAVRLEKATGRLTPESEVLNP